jgi:hypothetical protein
MYQHTPRGVQFGHIFDRATLRNSFETVRAWEPEHAIVAHSPWLCVDGKKQVAEFLDSAFVWLVPQPTVVEGAMTVARLLTLMLIILPIHALIVLTADMVYPKLIKQDESK